MSVAYEPRSFMNDGSYPTIGDEHDHGADHRYTDSDVAEHLSHYTADAAMLQDDRDVMDDERAMMGDDSGVVDDSTRLDLGPTGFSSPIHMPMQPQTTAAALQMPDPHAPMPDDAGSNHGSHNGTVVHKTESPAPPALGESPSTHQSSSRSKTMPKPDREVVKQADGKFHCPLHDCKEEVRSFSRKCEWKYVSSPTPL